MDVASGADLRLGLLLLLNAVVAVSAWWFVRRTVAGDWLDRLADAVLLFYLVQYVSVCGPGLLGMLGPVTMAGTAVGICAALWIGGRAIKKEEVGGSGWWPGVCLAFVAGYLGALAVYYRHLPVISNDSLTYHFPAAARWLATGRIGIFETWFFNPANTYSPLAGSAFIAWLMAPVGNDLIASFVQMPALVGVWVVVVRLGREVGLPVAVAVVAGTVLVVAQPFIRASVLSKDDLFVALFFVAALAGMSRRLAADRLGAWRIGAAAGLMLAVKYTALLAAPVLLLAIDGLIKARWSWKRWGIAAGCAAALAGPWFMRNWVEFGNPVFPVAAAGMRGLMSMRVSPKLREVHALWHILTGVDDAMPAVVLLAMTAGWMGWLVVGGKRVMKEPLSRAVAIGPVVGMGLFLWKAPYAEVRFLYPVFAMGAVAMAAGVMALVRDWRWGIGIAGLVLGYAALTGLPIDSAVMLLPVGVAAGALVWAAGRVLRRIKLDWTHGVVAGILAAAGIGMAIYVYWPAYVNHSAELAVTVWGDKYGPDLAKAWGFVRGQPAGEKVAYANTFLVYPLMGFEPVRPVEYVPVRRGVKRLADLPYLGEVTGEEMIGRVAQVTNGEPDEKEWLQKLSASGAKYLFVEKCAGLPEAPEFGMAERLGFHVVFDNDAARVYEIR